jgi:predicted ribosomally synthesized peptide with SipW-like signal peptide
MREDSSRPTFTRRAVLGSVAATGVAAAGAGAGTMALFQDSEESTGNSVQAGTLALDMHDGGSIEWTVVGAKPGGVANETQVLVFEHTGSVAADHLELDVSNVELEDDDGNLRTDGSWDLSPGPESDPAQGTSSTDGQQDPGASGMAAYVRVRNMLYEEDTTDTSPVYLVDQTGQPVPATGSDGTDHTLSDVNGNGFIDLQDLAHPDNADALDGFVPPAPGSIPGDSGTGDNDPVRDTKLQMNVSLDASTPNDYQGDAVVTTVSATLQQDSSQDA